MSGSNVSEVIYSHREKGGQYRLLSSDIDALPAGTLRELLGTGTKLAIYQDIHTNAIYVRFAEDFDAAMEQVIKDVVY